MAYVKRDTEKEIVKWLYEREIIAIRGPRQCGKTTLLGRLKEILIKDGAKDEQIHIINFEDDRLRLKFEADCKEFIKFYLSGKKDYFLLDEVQYVKDAGKLLKLAFDSFSSIKLIITGSSSFDLTNLGKYLVGRVIFFNLYPFSFLEFLRAKNEKYERLFNEIKINLEDIKIKETVFLEELNKLLHEYLTFGSYPRIVLAEGRDKKKELLKNLFTTYIEKDIVSLYGNKYRDSAVKLLKSLAYVVGNIIKYETVSESSGLKYNEVREIMPLLQDSFVISIVRPFYKNLLNELRKNPKIYFIDFGIRNYLLENFENLSFDCLYENFIYNELAKENTVKYWRTTAKTEVDFVIENKNIPIEVKTFPKITRALHSFIKVYSPKAAFVANLNAFGKKKYGKCNVYIVPFACF